MSALELMKLKNGSEAYSAVVKAVMLSLRGLMGHDPDFAVPRMAGMLAAHDLVELCRDPGYKVFGPCLETLSSLMLVEAHGEQVTVQSSIKDIVLSAFTGDGTELALGSPYVEE